MSLQASEALQEIGKVVRRFELRCVAGLDLDRLDAEDLPCAQTMPSVVKTSSCRA